ncbi:MAG: hypothetical protein ACYCY7_01890 [Gallionella sp.]
MLIWIDSSVLTADLATDHDSCHGISEIFAAAYRGEHYVVGARNTLTALAENQNLSSVTRTIISTIKANLPTLGAINRQIHTKMRVTHGGAPTYKRLNATEWEAPLKEIGICGIRKALILTENLNDAKAYEHAAKQYQVSIGMRGQVALERAGGGGSTTPDAFDNHANIEKRWCLCITDSDRLCPSDNMDTTAQKCSTIANNNSIVASHVDLEVREIENILPILYLAEAIPPTHQQLWSWHMEKLFKLHPDAHNYCDLKNGMTFRKILSYPANTPKRVYWNLVTTDLKHATALTSQCIDISECAQDNSAPCQCNVTNGFGAKLLESVIEQFDKQSAHQAEIQTRRDPNRQPWMDIGHIVFEWGCAPQKTRI